MLLWRAVSSLDFRSSGSGFLGPSFAPGQNPNALASGTTSESLLKNHLEV